MVSSEEACTLFLAGTVFFPGTFYMIQRFWRKSALGSDIKKRYQLTEKDCVDIAVKLVSTLQALLSSISGLIVCSKCYEDVLSCVHPLILLYAYFGAPYFVYDAFAMFQASKAADKHYKVASKKLRKSNKGLPHTIKQFILFVIKSPVIVVHHILMAPIGFSIILHFRGTRGDFFVGVMYLMEASTPFVSLRAILSKLKMKDSFLYKVNGALMLLTFPVFRIVSVFYTVGLYAEQQNIRYWEVFYNMHPGWLFVFGVSLAPQFYWFYLMLAGLAKMMLKSDKFDKMADLNSAQAVHAKNHEDVSK